MGHGQGRGVVDPVPGHRHDPPPSLELLHHLGLLGGQDLGPDLVDAERAGHRLGGGAAVPGQHDDSHPGLAQEPDRLGRGGLDRVGDSEEPGRATVDGDEHHGLTLVAKGLRPLDEVAGLDAQLRQERRGADRDRRAVHDPGHARPRHRPEVPRLREAEAARLGTRHDGGGERVLAPPLEARRQPEELRLGQAGQGDDRRQARLPLGERARLVHHERVDPLERLQGLGVAEQHAGGRAAARPDHDRHGRGQAERAGARDDQDGDGVHQGVGQPGRGADEPPDPERQHGDRDDGGHEVRRDPVGEALDRGSAPLRLAHELDDLGEERVASDALGAHHEAPGPVDRAAGDPVARPLLHRDRLAGDHRLVDGAPALEDDAVDRHLLTRADAEPVADLEPFERCVRLAPVLGEAAGRLRLESEERPDGLAGPAARLELEDLAEEHQDRDHGGDLEVHRHLALGAARRRGEQAGGHRRHHAVGVGDSRAEADQREHVRAPVHDRRPAALEKRPAGPEDDGRRQDELDPRQDSRGEDA